MIDNGTNYLAADRLLPYRPEFQAYSNCGLGLCDPVLRSTLLGLSAAVYDSCVFAAPIVAEDIVFPTGQIRHLFSTSVGAIIDGAWWAKTLADTNTIRDGEMSRRGQQYIIFGFSAECTLVVQRGDAGASADDAKLRSAWLAPAADGPNYVAQIKESVLNNTAGTITIADTGSTQQLMYLSAYPHPGQVRGGSLVVNGGLSVPSFFPNPVALVVGTQSDGAQTDIVLKYGHAETIEGGSPAPVAPDSSEDANVYAVVRVTCFGAPVCIPMDSICGVPMQGGVMVVKTAGRPQY